VLLAELRGKQPSASLEVDSATLLDAISTAAAGNASDRKRLAELADAAWAAPFDQERLDFQVAALARSLARIPAAELRAGHPAHALLTQLQRTLGTLIDR
jgi:hypothetical protein